MLDYQRIVDDVRSALFNNGQEGDDFLQAAAADYSLAIDEVNERLRHCGGLLRKGLRSESLQLCEIEPNLLDVVATLDFPERELFNDLLTLHGLGNPAKLLLDVAADLNEAYAIQEPLAALLQRHRMLALGHGPLKLRVDTLRHLALADAESPFWDTDLRTFEQERIKEIQQEVPRAITAEDMGALVALMAELQNGQWREHPPETLLRQITAARSTFARAEGTAELRRVGEQLRDAFAACDVDAGRRLRERWSQLSNAWGSTMDQNLSDHVDPALQWLEEQDELAAHEARHAAAVAALEQALAKRRPLEELDSLHGKTKREGGVPPSLENRYRAHLAAVDQAARRRNRWAISALAVLVMALAAVGFWAIQHKKHLGQVETAVQSLEQLLKDGKLDEASNFLDQLAAESPAVADDARIQDLKSRLQEQSKIEDKRRQAFAAALATARSSLDEKLPDDNLLKAADKLAVLPEEHDKVSKLAADIKTWVDNNQSVVDKAFRTQLQEFKDRLALVEKDAEKDPDSALEKLVGLSNELKKLVDGSPQVSAATKQAADPVTARLETDKGGLKGNIERSGQEEEITGALGDLARFRQLLFQYARKNPQTRRAIGFRDAAAESPLWDWLSQWTQLARSFGQQKIATLNRKDAREYVKKLKKLLDDRPGHPDADAFRQRLPYLEVIAARNHENGDPIEAPLKPRFADPLIAGAWVLKYTAEQRYYLLEDPAPKLEGISENGSRSLEYVVKNDLTKKQKTFHVSEIVSHKTAPQRVIAAKVSHILELLSDDNWESSFYKMAEAILADTETDPILKLFLLRETLDIGCQGSLFLKKAFAQHLEALKNSQDLTTANWVDPNDSEGPGNRSAAEAELATFSDFTQACNAAAEERKSLFKPVRSEYRPVGWLRQKLDKQWECVAPATERGSGKLFIVRAADGNETKSSGAILDPVGTMEAGKAAIDAGLGPAGLEGRPVFLALPATK